MSNATCFDPGTLKDYLLGKLSDEQSDAIAAHLEACLSCEATISQLDRASDTLTNGLRQPPVPAEPVTDDELQKVLGRVQSLEPASVGFRSAEPFEERKATILRDYRLLEPLGSGGMGTVYKAVHTRLDRLVAVKLLPARRLGDEQAVARFQREMRVIGQLSHPAIVQATDAGEVDGTHFLVMEFVEGFDLNTIAKACGPLSVSDACEIARQSALGLEYAHQQGIVHRDIKPSNLMLSRGEGRGVRGEGEPQNAESNPLFSPSPHAPHSTPLIKILDLGLALLSGEQAPVDELTTVGQLMGTLDYMAPEQLEDSHLVGPQADVYALAATLYRLLTGFAPFAKDDRKTPLQKLRALATQTAPPIRERRGDLPEALAAIIDRTLRRDPAERFATMFEFAAALAPWSAGHDMAALARKASAMPSSALSPWERAGVREPSQVRLPLQKDAGGHELQAASASPSSPRVPHPAFGHPLPEGEGTRPRRTWVAALLAVVGVIVFGVVIAIQTSKGTLIVESERDVEVRIKASGRDVQQFEVSKTAKSTTLAAGEYEIELVGEADGLKIDQQRIVLTRGDVVVAKVTEVSKSQARIGKKQLVEDEEPAATDQPAESQPSQPAEIVDRTAKGMETFEAANPDLAGEKKVREALLKPISIGFVDTPLIDVLQFFEDKTQTVLFLDANALNEEGMAADTPITLSLAEKPGTAVLEFLLRPLQLAWYIDGGQVVVTTGAKVMETLITRSYPVGKLLPGVRQAVERLKAEPPEPFFSNGSPQGGGGTPRSGGRTPRGGGGGFYAVGRDGPLVAPSVAESANRLHFQFGGAGTQPPQQQQGQPAEPVPTEAAHFEALLTEVPGLWLKTHGEGGSCELLHNVLVVRQTRRAHADIEALLRTVEAAFLKPPTEPVEVRPAGYSLEADANVRRQLARPLDVNFTDTPLTDVADWLGDQLNVQVLLDHEALLEEGIAGDTPVTVHFQGIAGDLLLSRVLKPLQLTHDIEHGVLVFTTLSKSKERLVTKVYDVRDLLARGLQPDDPVRGLEPTTPGPWQARDGEGGTMTLFADTLLVIRQTAENHDEIAKVLASLRSQLSDQPEVARVVKTRPKSAATAAVPVTKANPPNPTTPPPATKPANDGEPRYDSKTFDEWLALLDVERSPARLADALQALRLLHQDHQAATVARRLLMLFRTTDATGAYGDSDKRRHLSTDVEELLTALPQKVLETAAIDELKNGNTRSRKFVFYSVISSQRRGSFDSEKLARAVLEVSRDNDVAVRTAALAWLVQQPVRTWFPNVEDGIKTRFREALSDKTPTVALYAARGLLDSEPDTTAVVETLKRLIGTTVVTGTAESQTLQGEAMKLIAVMGSRASSAAPVVSPFLRLRETADRQRGIYISDFGGGGSSPFTIKSVAALTLARMGKSAASELPTINAALKEYGDSPRPSPDLGSRTFSPQFGPSFGGASSPRGSRLNQATFLELLLATKARLEDQPLPDPKNRSNEVKMEDTLPVQAALKLLQTEQALLEEHYGPGSEHPELRGLDNKLKAVEEEFNALWKLYNEQRKNPARKSSGDPSGGGAKSEF